MASTTFVDFTTVIESSWLNDINDLVYEGTIPASATWYPSAANKLIYTSAAGQLTSLTTAASSMLTTTAGGVPQWTSLASSGFVLTTTTITIAGTANEITSSAGAQDLSANRTWTLSLPAALTFTGKTITGGKYSSPSIAKLANLTTNGVVYTTSGDGTLSVDTTTHYKVGGTDVALSDGGTGASLVASNGGIIYSDADSMEVLAGTATAQKILMSQSSVAPIWSTPTYPNAASTALKHIRSDGTNFITSTATISDTPSTALKWLRSDGTNWITSTSTLSDTPSTAGKVLISDGTNWITSTPTFPNASATALKYIRSDGTNWIASTSTITDTIAQGDLLYGSASGVVSALTKNASSTRVLTNTGTNNDPAWAQVTLTSGVTGVLPVANGGTNASSASITAFNNITGYTAAGATGTTSTNLVFSTSPTLTTPILGTPTSGTLTNCTGYTEANLSFTDITTNDVSTTKHGFAPKAPNDATKYLDGTGAYTVPAGSGGAAVKITVLTASNSASLSYTTFDDATYKVYMLVFDAILPANDSVNLLATFAADAGVTYLSANYRYANTRGSDAATSNFTGSTSASSFLMNGGDTIGNAQGGYHGVFYFLNADVAVIPYLFGSACFKNTGGNILKQEVAGSNSTTAIDSLKFAMSSGNITSGTITIYGLVV